MKSKREASKPLVCS